MPEKGYQNWSEEKLRRKIDQHMEMFSLAMSDQDQKDADHHKECYQAYQEELRSRYQ